VDRVKAHFGEFIRGNVERYELPNLGALNFSLNGALEAEERCRRASMHKERLQRGIAAHGDRRR
jgi:hypothetical protein